jgi:DNA-binding GntR family transcriptional regulator
MAGDVLKRSPEDAGQPLYVQLAQALGQSIASGRYSVGEFLPTEAALGEAFQVSRYTVRQAIEQLRQQGLVSARKGVGTRIEARSASPSYTHSLHSLDEILQFAKQTQFELLSTEDQIVRGATAELLRCRPGKSWLRVIGIRYPARSDRPICRTEVYVEAAYKAIASDIGRAKTAICAIIERRFGETIVEIEQQIEATVLSAGEASILKAQEGAPALRIMRRYFVTGRRLIELSISLHPADRFSYAMTIKRDVSTRGQTR